MFEKSLLQLINDIQLESDNAELEVCEAMSEVYIKHAYILEYCNNDEFIQESIGENIKQGFGTILKAIGKVLKFIAGLIKRFAQWVVGLFRKNKKTADQICEECDLKPDKKQGIGEKIKLVIKRIRDGKESPITIEAISKDISVKLNKNDGTFEMKTYPDAYLKSISHRVVQNNKSFKNDNLTRNKLVSGIKGTSLILGLLKDDNIDKFDDFFTRFIKALQDNDIKTAIQLNTTEYPKIFNMKSVDDHVRIEYKKLVHIQKVISQTAIKFDEIRLNEFETENQIRLQWILNKIYEDLNLYQMSMNSFMIFISKCYTVDAKYAGCINDVETLAKFVDHSIEGGMPPEDIIQNCIILVSPEMRDDKFEEKSGQSRAVMFPKKDTSIVYKIALSGFGVISNKGEYTFTKESDKIEELKQYIALVNQEYSNCAIVTQERCLIKQINFSEIKNVIEHISRITDNASLKYDIKDLHSGNVALSKRTGGVVVIDYGWITRKNGFKGILI